MKIKLFEDNFEVLFRFSFSGDYVGDGMSKKIVVRDYEC